MKDFTRQIIPIKERIFRFAMRMIDNAAEAEDVVQEVLIKLWQKKGELSKIQNLEAWSIRLTRNLAIDKMRSKHYRIASLPLEFDGESESQNPAELLESRDALKRIHQLIQSLPEKHRLVIQLRDIEELSYKEIADILEMPMNQVKVNLFRARQSLKELLIKKESYGL